MKAGENAFWAIRRQREFQPEYLLRTQRGRMPTGRPVQIGCADMAGNQSKTQQEGACDTAGEGRRPSEEKQVLSATPSRPAELRGDPREAGTE